MFQRIGRLFAVAALSLVAVAAAGAQPAYATSGGNTTSGGNATPIEIAAQVIGGTNAAGTLATCYGGAVRSVFLVGRMGGDAGPFRTTTRCRDINVRNDSTYSTQACVIFIDVTDNCNYWTYLPAKSDYFTVATNVRDDVRFRVRFANSFYQYDPLVSYTAF